MEPKEKPLGPVDPKPVDPKAPDESQAEAEGDVGNGNPPKP